MMIIWLSLILLQLTSSVANIHYSRFHWGRLESAEGGTVAYNLPQVDFSRDSLRYSLHFDSIAWGGASRKSFSIAECQEELLKCATDRDRYRTESAKVIQLETDLQRLRSVRNRLLEEYNAYIASMNLCRDQQSSAYHTWLHHLHAAESEIFGALIALLAVLTFLGLVIADISDSCRCRLHREPLSNYVYPDRENIDDRPQCRICSNWIGSLYQLPCDCNGSIAWIHPSCWDQWYETKGEVSCDICRKRISNQHGQLNLNLVPPQRKKRNRRKKQYMS